MGITRFLIFSAFFLGPAVLLPVSTNYYPVYHGGFEDVGHPEAFKNTVQRVVSTVPGSKSVYVSQVFHVMKAPTPIHGVMGTTYVAKFDMGTKFMMECEVIWGVRHSDPDTPCFVNFDCGVPRHANSENHSSQYYD